MGSRHCFIKVKFQFMNYITYSNYCVCFRCIKAIVIIVIIQTIVLKPVDFCPSAWSAIVLNNTLSANLNLYGFMRVVIMDYNVNNLDYAKLVGPNPNGKISKKDLSSRNFLTISELSVLIGVPWTIFGKKMNDCRKLTSKVSFNCLLY